MIEYLFLRFSECLNPFFYNFGSNKMRKHTIMFLKQKVFYSIDFKKRKRDDVTAGDATFQSSTNLRVVETNLDQRWSRINESWIKQISHLISSNEIWHDIEGTKMK